MKNDHSHRSRNCQSQTIPNHYEDNSNDNIDWEWQPIDVDVVVHKHWGESLETDKQNETRAEVDITDSHQYWLWQKDTPSASR